MQETIKYTIILMTESWNITYTEIIHIQEVYKASGLHLGSLILDAKSKEVFPCFSPGCIITEQYNKQTKTKKSKEKVLVILKNQKHCSHMFIHKGRRRYLSDNLQEIWAIKHIHKCSLRLLEQHISHVQEQGRYWKYVVRSREAKPVSKSYL